MSIKCRSQFQTLAQIARGFPGEKEVCFISVESAYMSELFLAVKRENCIDDLLLNYAHE